MQITTRQVRAFAAVAQTQSFTVAAEHLGLTQSAVSMLVRQLETTLGLPLFTRTGRGVVLTEFGHEVSPVFDRVLSDLGEVVDAANGLTALSRGTLRLALTQVLAATWLPDVLAPYRQNHPSITIKVLDSVGDRIVEAIAGNRAEIGIGPARSLLPDVEAAPLWDVPIHLVVAGKQGSRSATEDPDVPGQWIHYSDEFTFLLEQRLQAKRIIGSVEAVRVRSLLSALALLRTGPFVTAAPSYAEAFSKHFGVSFDAVVDPPLTQSFMLYRRKDHPLSQAAKAFVEAAGAMPPVGATATESN